MLMPRIIPCLDVAGTTVVKGTRFVDLRVLGSPAEFAVRYEAEGADELVMLDITASREGRGPYPAVVEAVASRLSIPLTVGGGLDQLERIRDVLAAGADKVSLNTPAVEHPDLIEEAASRFGSQAVVVAIDVRRAADGRYRVYIRGGQEPTPWDLETWLPEVTRRGAGEILLTSIDQDGTRSGYDTALLALAASLTTRPIIASGGAAHAGHLRDGLRITGVTGALLAGVLHDGVTTIGRLKAELSEMGVRVRAV
jgi:cyclase